MEGSLASADCQLASAIVPADWNDRMLPLLVLVAVTRVFIQIQFAVSAAIDTEFDEPRGVLRGVLDLRAQGENGAGAHEERHAIERRIGFDFATADEGFAG